MLLLWVFYPDLAREQAQNEVQNRWQGVASITMLLGFVPAVRGVWRRRG